MFVGFHAGIAMLTNTPELIIQDAEGAAFMKASQNVMKHYSVETTQKTLDWIAFCGVACSIYVPRAVAIWAKGKGPAPVQVRRAPPAPVHAAQQPPAPANNGDIFTPSVPEGPPDDLYFAAE